MKANFDRFKRHLVPKISTLKPYQTRAHLLKYTPAKFGCWKLSLVSVVKYNVMPAKRHVSVRIRCSFQVNYRVSLSKIHS